MKKILLILLFMIFWELVAIFSGVSPAVFPKMSTIIEAIIDRPALFMGLVNSLFSVLLAGFICFLLLLFFVMISLWEPVRQFINHGCSLLAPIPSVALLPIVIVWFGLGMNSLLVILIHASLWAVWPIFSAHMVELKKRYGRLVKAYRIPLFRQITGLYLPGLGTRWISAVEISWSRLWRSLIAAEMIFGVSGTHSGIGRMIYERRMYMDTPGMYGSILLIALTGIAFESMIKTVQQKYMER